jgi:hypothetical protein
MENDPLYQLLNDWSDQELEAVLFDRGASPDKRMFAREILAGRKAVAQAQADAVSAAEAGRAERAVRAAETQATYAKRAYIRSNVAIGVSIAAIIVSGLFALLDFLKA